MGAWRVTGRLLGVHRLAIKESGEAVRAELRIGALSALTSVPSLLAIAILLLNDHVWKRDSPSWLTGKLSDFAGLLFAPYLAILLASVVPPRSSARLARALPVAAYAGVGALFVALKLSPLSAAPLLAMARLTGADVSIVIDPTDLIALSVLPISFAIWRRSLRQPSGHGKPTVIARYATLCAAALATLATSSPQPAIEGVVTDAVKPGTAYVVLGNTSADGVYATGDAGATWRRITSTTGRLFSDPTLPGTIYVLSGDSWDPALYRISDADPAGSSVKPPSPAGQRPQVLSIVGADLFEAAPWTSGFWYFARNGDLFRTATGGAEWTRVATPTPVELLATARSRGVVYFATPSGELYRSDDAGDSWVRAGALPQDGAALAVDPSDPRVLLAGAGKDLLRSEDGGASWLIVYSDRGPGSAHLARWVLRFDRTSGRVYAIFGFGCCALLVSTDRGLNWTDAGQIASYLAVDVTGSVYAVGPSGSHIYRSERGQGSWLDVTATLPIER